MSDCLFCKIIRGELSSWVVAEDEQFIAFLTPFPNSKGFTVVATKAHHSSYLFEMEDELIAQMTLFAKRVGKQLDAALGTQRTALIMEGMGINHAHMKLIPLHGIEEGNWQAINSAASERRFYTSYPGFVASHDGPKMEERELEEIWRKIQAGA